MRETQLLPREAVVWAYRLFLGREPESEAVIEAYQHVESIDTLRQAFLASDEFFCVSGASWFRNAWVAAPVMGGRYLMWIDLGDRYVSLGCLLDRYEMVSTQFVRGILREGDVFVDVGANVGWYTLLAASIVGESGKVHAFEPRSETVIRLEKTIALNSLGDRVTVHRCGLADADADGLLVWARSTDNPGGSHLSGEIPSGMLGERVSLETLDGLALPRLDFLKIDVEGAEMRVFAGGRRTIERCRPTILSELGPEMLARVSGASTDEFFGYFAGMGYRCHIVDHERLGEEIRSFPGDYGKPLLNLGLVPKDRPADLVARIFAGTGK